MPEQPQDIYFWGFDKNLNRNVVMKSPLIFDSFEIANPSLLTSGPLLGNLTLADGNFQSGNFTAGSAGYQMTSTGYFEANTGVFRGDLSIGSGNNIILADPDDTTWRLGVGNADISQAPFRVDKDGNAYGIGFKTLENFTAGEDIVTGDVVCLKNSWTSALVTTAGYVSDFLPDNNYGGETELFFGTDANSTYYFFVKVPLDTVPTNFQSAELVFYFTSFGAGNSLSVDMASADAGTAWTESNLTWNNKPESFFDSDDPGGQYIQTLVNNPTLTLDITQTLKLWKKSIEADYGFRFRITNPTALNKFASDDNADTTIRPFVRWLTHDVSDGLAYRADSSNYNNCRQLLGIAYGTSSTTIVSGNNVPVQRTGKTTLTGAGVGGKRYLDNANPGGCNVATPAGLPRAVMVGVGTTTGELYINVKDQNLFIETVGPFNIQASDTIHTVVVHPDSSKAVVEYIMNRATTYSAQGNFTIDPFGQSAVEIQHSDLVGSNKEFNATWNSSNEYITINSESAATSGSDYLTYKIHLYT